LGAARESRCGSTGPAARGATVRSITASVLRREGSAKGVWPWSPRQDARRSGVSRRRFEAAANGQHSNTRPTSNRIRQDLVPGDIPGFPRGRRPTPVRGKAALTEADPIVWKEGVAGSHDNAAMTSPRVAGSEGHGADRFARALFDEGGFYLALREARLSQSSSQTCLFLSQHPAAPVIARALSNGSHNAREISCFDIDWAS